MKCQVMINYVVNVLRSRLFSRLLHFDSYTSDHDGYAVLYDCDTPGAYIPRSLNWRLLWK